MDKLKLAMWIPGLFWLFPVWLYMSRSPEDIRDFDVMCHGFWSAAQIVAVITMIAEIYR